MAVRRPTKSLTQKAVSDAVAGPREWMLTDPQLPGFGVRIHPSGAKSYVYLYRNLAQRSRKYTIGSTSHLTLEQARKLAKDAAYRVRCDEDPAASKKKARATTLAVIFEEYDSTRLTNLSSGHQLRTRNLFRDFILPRVGDMPITAISRSTVRELTDKKTKEGYTAAANNVHRAISGFLTWCSVDRTYLPSNPLYGIPLPSRHKSRDRVLDRAELTLIWNACSHLNPTWCNGIRLLMLTGLRRNEVLGAETGEIDVQRRVWTIPEERSKNRQPHRVYLTDQVLALLREVPGFPRRQFLFQSDRTKGPKFKPVAETTASIRKLKKLVPIADWTIHDLRRSVASHMAALGTAVPVIEAVLNHRSGSRSGVAGIYNRYNYEKEAAAAWELWAKTLEQWINNPPPVKQAPVAEEDAVLI